MLRDLLRRHNIYIATSLATSRLSSSRERCCLIRKRLALSKGPGWLYYLACLRLETQSHAERLR